MERTLRWARRARDRFLALRDGLVPGVTVTQSRAGAVRHRAGRRVSGAARGERARRRSTIGFEAYAIGGLSVGEPPDVMYEMVSRTTPCLPADRPRYLMGDRHAARIWSSRSPAASTCSIACCRRATRGTASCSPARAASTSRTRGTPRTIGRSIRPAAATPAGPVRGPICGICFMAGEINAATLNTLHNLHFYLDTLRQD